MDIVTENNLSYVHKVLEKTEVLQHACHVLQFDQETICPPLAMEEQGEVIADFSNRIFKKMKKKKFLSALEYIYEHREELDSFDRALADVLHRNNENTKQITPQMDHDFSLVFNRAFVTWSKARETGDYSVFAPSLEEVCKVEKKITALRPQTAASPYDSLLDDYEHGMTSALLDECFGACKERMIPLMERIRKSPKTIRTDFLTRTVTDEQQRIISEKLLHLLGFDFQRGAFTTSEHPFTDRLGKNDVRVTTHYYPNQFLSSIYSIIHECGHALFDQNQPVENALHHLDNKTMGQHESVSRFYENRIGRSLPFTETLYPMLAEVFPQVLSDVTPRQLYEAVNLVQPSLIRTEADEFTYTFHIIIRYEIERDLMNGLITTDQLPQIWKEKYMEYLGVSPDNDRDGILQDVHWTSGFGYFPTYALGNMYNAMYYNRLKNELDIERCIREGRICDINSWMKQNVWTKADRLAPSDWIRDITGRDFTPKDFLDYLEEKYGELYQL